MHHRRLRGDASIVLDVTAVIPLCGAADCRQETLRQHVAMVAHSAAAVVADTCLQLLNKHSSRRLGRCCPVSLVPSISVRRSRCSLSVYRHSSNTALL